MSRHLTPEALQALDAFHNSLFTVQNLTKVFHDAPPSVDAEPYQSLLNEAVENLTVRFDALCSCVGLPN